MKTTVLFFGPLAEITGTASMEMEGFPDTHVLQAALLQRFPALAERKYAMALNKTLVRTATPLEDGSTLAFLPPFSGG